MWLNRESHRESILPFSNIFQLQRGDQTLVLNFKKYTLVNFSASKSKNT